MGPHTTYFQMMEKASENETSKPSAETDPLLIAHLAALIFANNAHDFDERRAVQSAAKILELSRNNEK